MHAKEILLRSLLQWCRRKISTTTQFDWSDCVFLRTVLIRYEHGDESAWSDFLHRIANRSEFKAIAIQAYRRDLDFIGSDPFNEEQYVEMIYELPKQTVALEEEDARELLELLANSGSESEQAQPDERPQRQRDSRSSIMFLDGSICVIARVFFSQSRKTIYYKNRRFRSLKGMGHLCNYYDIDAHEGFWISNCRRDGLDTLYPGIVEIDDNVREEYWTNIRERSDLMHLTKFRSEGKYSKRRPEPALPNHTNKR